MFFVENITKISYTQKKVGLQYFIIITLLDVKKNDLYFLRQLIDIVFIFAQCTQTVDIHILDLCVWEESVNIQL